MIVQGSANIKFELSAKDLPSFERSAKQNGLQYSVHYSSQQIGNFTATVTVRAFFVDGQLRLQP